MKALFISMRGVRRSWGCLSVGHNRWSEEIPTASAVLGLLGACIGLNARDSAAVKAWYAGFFVSTCSVFEFTNNDEIISPTLLTDFQTAQGSFGMSCQKKQEISYRQYYTDGFDVAAVLPRHQMAEEWTQILVSACEQPIYTPYLGRRSNPLSAPLRKVGEKLDECSSVAELGEKLHSRMVEDCGWDVSRCLWRVPQNLELSDGVVCENWVQMGDNMVMDQRSSGLRFFSNRAVVDYLRRGDSCE